MTNPSVQSTFAAPRPALRRIPALKVTLAAIFALCLMCSLMFTPAVNSAEPAGSLKSEAGKKLIETFEAGVPFDGMTASRDESVVWPGKLFLRLKDNTLDFEGHIEWTTLNHVNYVEGTISEMGNLVQIDFKSTKVLVKGTAAYGVDYHAVVSLSDGQVQLLGQWSHGESLGPFEMISKPDMAGQQSALLGMKTFDEALAAQDAEVQAAKPKIIWEEEALDWKIAGFEYPNGDRFVRLQCSWARDRLAEGASPGTMMIIHTTADDSPMLAFEYERHSKWKEALPGIKTLKIYFSHEVQYDLPVEGQANGWVYSTDPVVVRQIVGTAIKNALNIDADMIVYTGVKGLLGKELTAHISIKGFKEAWIAKDYFMRGEQPPTILEILQRDDR